MCHENLVRKPPIVVGASRVRERWRRAPLDLHTKEQVDAYFAKRPLPGRR
jgi:hypothetical protein